MKFSEIVQQIRQEQPAALGQLSDRAAVVLIRQAFARIAQSIDSTEDGIVTVAGLGRLRIKTGEKDKDGAKVKVKRIILKRGVAKKKEGVPTTKRPAAKQQKAAATP